MAEDSHAGKDAFRPVFPPHSTTDLERRRHAARFTQPPASRAHR
jgi:hypothetical protein